MDQEVQHLSGGELQRVAITMCLGLPADIYLIDEPSAYLDSEQRIIAAKVRQHILATVLMWSAQKPHRSAYSRGTGAQRRSCSLQVIKRFIMHSKKTAFIVEHDFIMAAYLADRVILYEGQPSKEVRCSQAQCLACLVLTRIEAGARTVDASQAYARTPQSLLSGMNAFLKNLDITFRRDPTNYRPRINKLDSLKDREQKLAGNYYYIDD